MIIIGITGTIGAGKGTIVEYLQNKLRFEHFSVRAYLIKELKKRGLEINRDTMTSLANELRSENSPSYITDQLFLEAEKSHKNCIIESVRTPGEITSLREKGAFYLLAVDAPSRLRYDRITLRKSETDHISYDTFLANEEREMSTTDPNKQNLKKCIELADFVLNNQGTVEDLHLQLENILKQINP
ncbi:MAG: AAA family ATPase [Bacteroidales bacterium]